MAQRTHSLPTPYCRGSRRYSVDRNAEARVRKWKLKIYCRLREPMESQKHPPCALCAAERPLRLSHVIPKFVSAWMKSRGEFIRGFGRPNLPLQDGPKVRMLWGPCESRLLVWERAAATSLFRPANSASNAHFVDYGSWLLPFAVSLSFRV